MRSAIASWLALAACTPRDIVAVGSDGSAGDPAAYCLTAAPPILLGDVCTGSVAVAAFQHALCTCQDDATSTPLVTDSFDSAAGPYGPGGTSGDVGIDGALSTSAPVTVGGSLAVAGSAGATLLADLHVAQDLDVGGPLGSGVSVVVGGNANLAGDVALAALTVAGTLTLPPQAALDGTVTAAVTTRAPVAVAPPCPCDPNGSGELIDIDGMVASHATDNDDAAIGLGPDDLTGYAGDVTLDLPCGIYYVRSVTGSGALTLRITGRVALLVDGDIALVAPLGVQLATDDAELDVLVAGLVSSNDAITIGRADHPSRTRIYIGGTGAIDLSGNSQIAANVYAPNATVALSANATVYGSLVVRRLEQAAPVAIHYDIDIRRADVGCPL